MKSNNIKKHELKKLIVPLFGQLNKVAMYLCKNRDTAEDLVAETLLKVCENINKLKDKSKFKSWVFRIMNNEFISNYRKNKSVNSVQLDEDFRRNINLLPEEFRMTVILCDIENLSYKEISEITRVPAGTVRSRLSRGRAILQKKLHHIALE